MQNWGGLAIMKSADSMHHLVTSEKFSYHLFLPELQIRIILSIQDEVSNHLDSHTDFLILLFNLCSSSIPLEQYSITKQNRGSKQAPKKDTIFGPRTAPELGDYVSDSFFSLT